jgi:hypothetical protein
MKADACIGTGLMLWNNYELTDASLVGRFIHTMEINKYLGVLISRIY